MGIWKCKGCKRKQGPGLRPCRKCCGYTADPSLHANGVTDAYGHLAGMRWRPPKK